MLFAFASCLISLHVQTRGTLQSCPQSSKQRLCGRTPLFLVSQPGFPDRVNETLCTVPQASHHEPERSPHLRNGRESQHLVPISRRRLHQRGGGEPQRHRADSEYPASCLDLEVLWLAVVVGMVARFLEEVAFQQIRTWLNGPAQNGTPCQF